MKSIYIKSFLTIFIIFNIISISYFFFNMGTYNIFVLIACVIWIYILLNTIKIKKLFYKYSLTIIVLMMLSYIILYLEGVPLIIKTPFVILLSSIIIIPIYFHYVAILMIIVSLIFIFYIKKQRYLNLVFLLLIIVLFNLRYVFISNQNYNQQIIKETPNTNKLSCIQEIFYDSSDYGDFSLYKYHTPKNNPILPTLGIRYKENYEEERGIIVIYEKRSYLNFYVGDGKALCPDDNSSIVETLE